MDATTVVLAPAKINLALHVTGRRPDGYHLIETLVAFTRFGDRLTIAEADRDGFAVSGPFAAAVPADGDNLVVKAVAALRAHAGGGPPVSITLEKNLPVASGIGGGSSDAATAMRALVDLWRLDIDAAELSRIGLTLGADLPMCLAARPLIARGVGEAISEVHGFPPVGTVLVNPGKAVATADIFAALERRDGSPLPPLPRHLDFHALCNWLETTRNDLEAPASRQEPSIDAALKALRKAGAHFVRMSGSGATCYGLFESGNLAKRAAASIRARQPGWFVAATRFMSSQEGSP
jgi:4-diphosphocytidyl-2-C-methyl-D-erythritol kinase